MDAKDQLFDTFYKIVEEAYIIVCGKDRWDSLTKEQKQDMTINLIGDLGKRVADGKIDLDVEKGE